MTITGLEVMEPSTDQDVTAAVLTLTTSTGGALQTEVKITVTAINGTASM